MRVGRMDVLLLLSVHDERKAYTTDRFSTAATTAQFGLEMASEL